MNRIGKKLGDLGSRLQSRRSGKYVSFKEILAYGIGGMGRQFVASFAAYITLSATSFLVGNTIGIKPLHLQYMSVLSTFIGFALTILRSYVIDNSHFKMGKFRPWLAIMGIPTVIVSIVFVWLPYETMSYAEKVAAVFICYNLLQCFFPFYTQSFDDLINVISPDSRERTDIMAITSIIWSFAPSLTGAFVPMLSSLTGGLNNIRTYRVILPCVAVLGLAMCYIAVFGTKERIVEAKSHVSHFSFIGSIRAVSKNKYFWITSLAGWMGFLEGAISVIIGWTFIYGYPDKMVTYGIVTTLIGNASLWSMLLCPFAIRKIGKRNLLIWCNVANIFLIGALYPVYRSLPALVVLYYLNAFVSQFAIVYNPGINADIRDYQQYITGERIDGMFGAVGVIGSFIGMFTGMVLPTIYNRLGLGDNYDVLEVASFREDMFEVLIIAAVIGAAMNIVPYLFYDLTETKQKGIARVLKIRAALEDYGNGVLSPQTLSEAVEMIEEARSFNESATGETAERRRASRMTRAEKAEKKRLSEEALVNEFVMREIEKYSSPVMQFRADAAQKTVDGGLDALCSADRELLREASAMPRATPDERLIRGAAISNAREKISAGRLLRKYYADSIGPNEDSEKKNSRYLRATRPLLDAERLLREQKNYSRLDELKAELKGTEYVF